METQIVQFEPKHKHWPMYRAMVGLGLLCSVIIVSVYQATLPVIRQNKIDLLQRSLYQLFPDAVSFQYYAYANGQFSRLSSDVDRASVISSYDSHQMLAGFAIRARGMGYQDVIELLYAYSPVNETITGFRVLDSRETPGLGSRIETDKVFLGNFSALVASLDATGTKLAHSIEVVKNGRKQQPWQIDTITGATISSRAVGRIISTSANHWLPLLVKQRMEFSDAVNRP